MSSGGDSGIKQSLAAGLVGAVLGGFASQYKSHVPLESITCAELQDVLGDSPSIGLERFSHVTGLTQYDANRIFNFADSSRTAGTTPIEVDILCTYLDADEDGRISKADLSQKLFNGSLQKADRFLKQISRLLHAKPESDSAASTAPYADFEYWLRNTMSKLGACKSDDELSCVHVTYDILSIASVPPKVGNAIISEKLAQSFLNKARCDMTDHGWTLTFEIESRGLAIFELFAYLICPSCGPDVVKTDAILEIDHLLVLTHEDRDEATLLMSLIRRQRRGVIPHFESPEDEIEIDRLAREEYDRLFELWKEKHGETGAAAAQVAYNASPMDSEPIC